MSASLFPSCAVTITAYHVASANRQRNDAVLVHNIRLSQLHRRLTPCPTAPCTPQGRRQRRESAAHLASEDPALVTVTIYVCVIPGYSPTDPTAYDAVVHRRFISYAAPASPLRRLRHPVHRCRVQSSPTQTPASASPRSAKAQSAASAPASPSPCTFASSSPHPAAVTTTAMSVARPHQPHDAVLVHNAV